MNRDSMNFFHAPLTKVVRLGFHLLLYIAAFQTAIPATSAQEQDPVLNPSIDSPQITEESVNLKKEIERAARNKAKKLSPGNASERIIEGVKENARIIEDPPLEISSGDLLEQFKLNYFEPKVGRLAFTYEHLVSGEPQKDIYYIDFKELKIKAVTNNKVLDEYPRWSPDGRKLAFYSDRSGNRDIYSSNPDGSEFRKLTRFRGLDEDPDWSPDGKRIVFQRAEKSGTALFVMNADGSGTQKLPLKKKKESSVLSVPKWSPRGDEILFSTNDHWPGWDIVVLSLVSGKSSVLTKGRQSFCRGGWHPDGGRFAFSLGRGKNINLMLFERGAAQMDMLVENPGRLYDAEWNEDGSLLFYSAELDPGSGRYQIFVYDIAKKKSFQVTNAPGSIRHVSWTPLPDEKLANSVVDGTNSTLKSETLSSSTKDEIVKQSERSN